MNKTCKEKAAFICRYGTFRFEVSLLGLMNAQAAFETIMDIILCNDANVECCIDEFVTFMMITE